MPRRMTAGSAGFIFHVINRGARRLRMFDHDGDYLAWLRCFAEAHRRQPVDVFAYCIMPNHFHMVVRPNADGQLAEFMRLGTVTHSKRWHQYRGSTGTGAVYQGRYGAFPIQTGRYFMNACRYVEANALRAGLVERAEDWKWSSLAARCRNRHVLPVAEWPILPPPDWLELVNANLARSDELAIRRSVVRSVPLGAEDWTLKTGGSLGLLRGLRSPGRPKKTTPGVVS